MRFKDWDQYAERFPAEADLLEREWERNDFLRDMRERIRTRKDLNVRMRQALANWVNRGSTSVAVEMPRPGEFVTTRIEVHEAERVQGKYGIVNTYRFGSTADGWNGRLETNSAEIEDEAMDAGVTFDKTRIDPPWRVTVHAKVAWVADQRPFAILGGTHARIVRDGHVAPPNEYEAAYGAVSAPESEPELPTTGKAMLPDCKDWKASLGL